MISLRSRGKAVVWISASVVLFAVFDAVVKYLAAFYPVTSLIWSRYAMHVVVMGLFFARAMGLTLVSTDRKWLQVLRGLLMLGVSLCMMNAAHYLPLAELTAIYFTYPLVVTLLAPLLLKERIDRYSSCAVILGFIGLVVVVRPNAEMTSMYSLMPLLAAVLFALFQILTRFLSETENPISTNFMTGLTGVFIMSLLIPTEITGSWILPEFSHVPLFLVLGFTGFAAQQCMINAFNLESPNILAPLSFLQIGWAVIIGLIVFGDVPSTSALVGIGLIAIGGLAVAFKKRSACDGLTSR